MAKNQDRDLEVSSSRWLGIMFTGVVCAIPGFFAFAMGLSHGTHSARNTIVSSTYFFGPIVLAVFGLLGYTRTKRRQQIEREREADRATHG